MKGGIRIRKRITSIFTRRRRRHGSGSSIFTWMRRKAAGFIKPGSGYFRLSPVDSDPVPKGHLAVYVGQNCCRLFVPVIYFNHPLFGRLLNQAEDQFGFHYPGRITIPCPLSEFQSVTTRIEAAVSRRTRPVL